MMSRRVICWIETPLGLACLFALGLGIRLVLAWISDGFWFDVSLFRLWSVRLAQRGLEAFYTPTVDYVVDYPPGYLYVLFLLAKASRVLFGGAPPTALLKLPAIVSDIVLAVLVMALATRVTSAEMQRQYPIRAMAAGSILFNPAVILISAVWGQVDSLLAVLVLGTTFVLTDTARLRHEVTGVALLAVALATKPQVVFAIPVITVLLFWRHRSDGWWAAVGRFTLLGGVVLAVVLAMFSPFGVSPSGVLRFYRNAGSLYPFTSLWAFNLWGLVGFYRPDVGTGAAKFVGAAAFHVALVLFALMAIVVVAQCWRSLAQGVEGEVVLLLGTAAMTCAAFALLTRTHERYLYLALPVLAPLVGHRRLRHALACLSLLFFLNVHFVYVYNSQHASPPGNAWTIDAVYNALFGDSREALQLKILSAVTAATCLAVAAFGFEWLTGRVCARGTRSALAIAGGVGRA